MGKRQIFAGGVAIPPRGSGRPKGRIRTAIEGLAIGGRVTFKDTPKGTISGAAWHAGKALGRAFVTRQESARVIAVWRLA